MGATDKGLRVIGAGLSRTGTSSLTRALEILGYRTSHYDERIKRVLYGFDRFPDFAMYDDLDAVTDTPTAVFYRELMRAYPSAKVILTVREIESWWNSISSYFAVDEYDIEKDFDKPYHIVRDVRYFAFGSYRPYEYIYKKRYREHNEQVVEYVPKNRLLVMNICDGDGWEALCEFLGVAEPEVDFPYLNAIGTKHGTSKIKSWLRF